MYKGGPLCNPWLRSEKVFVDLPYTQDVVNSVAVKLLGTVHETKVRPVCKAMFKEAVCRYLYPNCTTTDTGQIERAKLCKSCAKLFKDCADSFIHMIDIAQGKFPNLWEDFKPVHVKQADLSCDLWPSAASNQNIPCLTLRGGNDFMVYLDIRYSWTYIRLPI